MSGADEIRLGLTEDSDLSTELGNLDITYDGRRSATGFNWQRLLGTRGVGLFGLTYSRATVNQRVKDLIRGGVPSPGTSVEDQLAAGSLVFREASTESDVTVKYDLTTYVPWLGKVQGGASLTRFQARYDAESPFGTDSPFFPVPDVNPFSLDERISTHRLGGYGQTTRALTGRLNATIGGRIDRYQYIDASRFSPRVGLDYEATRRVSLRASYGQYFQLPPLLFLAAYGENRSLEPFRADHYVAGIVYAAGTSTRFSAEVYRKNYRDYPVSSQIPALSLANLGDTFAIRDTLFPMISAGRGKATGIEFFAERKAGAGRWHGQANFALSRVRHGGKDGVLRPGSFGYPVVANVVGGYRLSPRWEISTRLTYLRGRPFTPFDPELSVAQRRAVYDPTQVNARRAPDYFRLDLRLDRNFVVAGRDVSVFAGLQNITDRRNVAGYAWDRRQNVVRTNEQLGIFPILGLDWHF